MIIKVDYPHQYVNFFLAQETIGMRFHKWSSNGHILGSMEH